MFPLDVTDLPAYLRSRRLLGPNERCQVEPLSGGVSNVVLRVEPESRAAFVVKQARERLHTDVPWFSRLDRIFRETAVMAAIQPLLPDGALPAILDVDRENYAYAMEAIDPDHIVWKRELLAGRIREEIAIRLADYLSAIHRGTAGSQPIAEEFGDREVFEQLRVDPFYRHVARVHPDLAGPVARLIDEMEQNCVCLVHADFSPKNVLVVDRRPAASDPALAPSRQDFRVTLIDFETGHFGDPAFDLGFFLSHLWLKGVRSGPEIGCFLRLSEVFWERYRTGIATLAGSEGFEPHEVERRTVTNLAACALARIDGTSPVDYLRDPGDRQAVREFASRALRDAVSRLSDAASFLQECLASHSASVTADRAATTSQSLPQSHASGPAR
jgi:5-methylthioribose kinase